MAYFPNGMAGDIFEAEWCSRCAHEGGEDGPGCPVMLAHLLYSYELCNAKDHPGKVMLDMLIPDAEPAETPACAMFHEATDADRSTMDRKAREREDRARYAAAMAEMRGDSNA